jgi:hypothetical protein
LIRVIRVEERSFLIREIRVPGLLLDPHKAPSIADDRE